MRLREADPDFDKKMYQRMLMSEEQTQGLESRDIWQYFYPKFDLVWDLMNFKPFFVKLLKETLAGCLAQNLDIVEFRHTPGCVYDENEALISVTDEIGLMQAAVDEMKQAHPTLEVAIILQGLKAQGQAAVDSAVADY